MFGCNKHSFLGAVPLSMFFLVDFLRTYGSLADFIVNFYQLLNLG